MRRTKARGGGKKPIGRWVPRMARGVPIPVKNGPQGQEPYWRRTVEQGMHGVLFLLNYISHGVTSLRQITPTRSRRPSPYGRVTPPARCTVDCAACLAR